MCLHIGTGMRTDKCLNMRAGMVPLAIRYFFRFSIFSQTTCHRVAPPGGDSNADREPIYSSYREPLCGYGHAVTQNDGTQNDSLSEAGILSIDTPISAPESRSLGVPARPYPRYGHAINDADIEPI